MAAFVPAVGEPVDGGDEVLKTTLRDLARRWKTLDEEIKAANRQIGALVRTAAPALVELHGVGIELAGQFLVTTGDNAERIRNEGAFLAAPGTGRFHDLSL